METISKDIDMVPYGEPDVPNFGHGDKTGFSLNQWISTSNITGHFVNELCKVYLNIFHCKNFDKEVAINLAKRFWKQKLVVTILL